MAKVTYIREAINRSPFPARFGSGIVEPTGIIAELSIITVPSGGRIILEGVGSTPVLVNSSYFEEKGSKPGIIGLEPYIEGRIYLMSVVDAERARRDDVLGVTQNGTVVACNPYAAARFGTGVDF